MNNLSGVSILVYERSRDHNGEARMRYAEIRPDNLSNLSKQPAVAYLRVFSVNLRVTLIFRRKQTDVESNLEWRCPG